MVHSLQARQLLFPFNKKNLLYLSAFIIGATGLALIIRSSMKAAAGSPEALWTMIAFFSAILVFAWLIRAYWQVILDQSDILDVFRKTAREKKSRVEPALIRTDRTNLFFKEQGYRFRLKEYLAETEINLIQIEMETPDHFISQTGSYYLVFRIPSEFKERIAFIHPKSAIENQPDTLLYCPDIPNGEALKSHAVAMIFTFHPAEWTDSLFDNPFIVNDLNVLFSIYRLKYISLADGKLTAVKVGIVDSCAYDIEAYHLLHRLVQLIQDHFKRNSV